MTALAAVSLGACVTTATDSSPPAPVTTEPAVEHLETISVSIRLPATGHMDSIDGWVIDSAGDRVAAFEFDASFEFVEEPSGDNNHQPPTSLTNAATVVEVKLPGGGTYVFEIGDVAYWGGCGTCGRGLTGGSVEASVVDGSTVELDLGDLAWES